MSMEYDRLGSIIKSARISKQLTRKELGEKLCITQRHLIAIENENQKPSYDLLFNLIRELSIPADTIFYPELGLDTAVIDKLRLLLSCCGEKEIDMLTATLQLLTSGKT